MFSWELNTFTKHTEQVCFLFICSFYTCCFVTIVYWRSPRFRTFPLHVNTQDESVLFLLVVLQLLCIYALQLLYFSHHYRYQKEKLKALTWPPTHFVVKFNKSLNTNIFICSYNTPENNNKPYLVSYFYKHVAFLWKNLHT